MIMRMATRIGLAVSLLLGAVLGVNPCAQAQESVEITLPNPVPFYAGDAYELSVQMGGGMFADVATSFPMFFYRPMDTISPRAGADAWGMGGAHLAMSRGAKAMAWNPAALGRMERAELAADGFFRSSSGTGSALPDTVHIEGQPEFGIDDYTWKLSGFNGFGFLGGATPLTTLGRSPLVAGAAYRRHTEAAWGQETLLEMGLLEGTGFPFVVGTDVTERGSIESFTASLGYEVVSGDQVSVAVGASANFLRGRLRSEMTTDVAVRDFESGRLHFQKDYKGFSAEVGVLADVTELVSLAGWMSLPYTLEVTNSRFNQRSILTPDQSVVVYFNGEVADYDIEVPAFFSGGVRVGPIRGITLAADLNQRNWSEAEIKHTRPGYEVFDGPYPSPDLTSYHLGAEFEFPLLRDAIRDRGMQLMSRLGYRTIPLGMYDLDPVEGEAPYYFGDPVEGEGYSFGFSLLTSADIRFDVGVEFQSFTLRRWFLDDTRPTDEREISFDDPYDRAPIIDLSATTLRLSTAWAF